MKRLPWRTWRTYKVTEKKKKNEAMDPYRIMKDILTRPLKKEEKPETKSKAKAEKKR